MWRYTVSHAQLVLRASKGLGDPEADTRVEVLFKNAQTADLPAGFVG
jgi:hypothetical protein